MSHRAKPLYRKVNTRTYGVNHGHGGKSRWDRNTKAAQTDDRMRGAMHAHRHGRDYTPLFRFLISKVGQPWATVHAAAVARLDDPAPIFWLVALHPDDGQPTVRIGENSFFSGLYITQTGDLAKVDPTQDHTTQAPSCGCCTHTFNGERFTRPFVAPTGGGTPL